MSKRITDSDATRKHIDSIKYNSFPLNKANFILMAISGFMIVLGFFLMSGEPSGDTFNPEIFSTKRIVVGPTISFLGFLFMAFGIIYKKKDKANHDSNNKE